MSIFYEQLKKKALDETKKDEMVIVGKYHLPSGGATNYCGMTYTDVLRNVDAFIDVFKNQEYTDQSIIGNRKYIVVDNSLNSIFAIIALLECGSIPVIIDSKNVPGIEDNKLPYLDYGDYVVDAEKEDQLVEEYLNKLNIDENLLNEKEPGCKLIICSSGSEGATPHLNTIMENDLVKLPNQYGDSNSIFLSYISCANISGILTNLVNFLVHDVKLMLTQDFNLETIYFAKDFDKFLEKNFKRKYIENRYFCSTANPALMKLLFLNKSYYDGKLYDSIRLEGDELVVSEMRPNYQMISFNDRVRKKIQTGTLPQPDTMMLPRNILKYLKEVDLEEIDLSSMRHIYLSGGINSEEVVKKVREMIPSIPKGIFTNLYGSTEANGVICTCDEKDFKTCYINVGDYELGKITYSFDMKKFYEISNGITKEIEPPKDLFEYMPYLNVSSKQEKMVTVDNKLQIKYNGKETGDIGIYIGDQLYILGRKSDIIKLKGRTYIAHSLESYYSNEIGSTVYIRPIDEEGIQLFMKESPIKFTPEFIKRYEKALNLSKETKRFHVNPPVVLDDYIFAESKISGKISKPYLLIYEDYAKEQLDAFFNIPNSIIEKSKKIAESLAAYSPEVLSDGSFLIDVSKRLTLPITDIILNFYKPTYINNDLIRFIPKPEIIFMTEPHKLFSNQKMVYEYSGGILQAILEKALKLKQTGELLTDKYQSINEKMHGEEIIEKLRYDMMIDVVRRLVNKRQYENYSKSFNVEEPKRLDKIDSQEKNIIKQKQKAKNKNPQN